MPKTVPPSKFQEWVGLDRISLISHQMKCIFREINKDDFGIDGEIEIVREKPDGGGYETTGGIIKVQSKSGQKYVIGDSETQFSTPVELKDLHDWHKSNYPVILIVYHPKDDKLYWKEIKSYVKSAPAVWRPPHRVVYDKAADEFNTASYEGLCSIAQVSPPRVSMHEQERLYSNLLRVKKLPVLLTSAPTDYKDYDDIRADLEGYMPPCCVVDGRLYTLDDLRNHGCQLRPFCDTDNIDDDLAEKWAGDDLRRNDLVFMLKKMLGSHLGRCGLRYNRDFRRNYFAIPEGTAEREFKRDWRSVRTGRDIPGRTVAKYYEYGLDKFWRHTAADLSFKRIGRSWFLQIIPKYLFTVDGETPSPSGLVGPYTTRQKARERNNHVLNHVLFWSDVLSQGGDSIELQVNYRTVMVIDKEPVKAIANFAIPYDPAVYEEEEEQTESGQVDLFELLSGRDDTGVEDDEY